MRRTLLAIALSLACAVAAVAGDFSDGWRCGWVEGYQQVKGPYSFSPFPPFAPFPPLGCDSYRDGWRAGFLEGAEAAEER